MMKAKFLPVLILLVIPFTTYSQILKMELTEIITQADLVLKGQVVKTEAKWHEDEGGRHIYTYADVEIHDVIKGNYSDNVIRLKTMGGNVGDVSEFVSDSYMYREGEEFIIFINSKNNMPVGSHQGILSISNGEIYFNNKILQVNNFVDNLKNYLLHPSSQLSFDYEIPGLLKISTEPTQGKEVIMEPAPEKLEINPNIPQQQQEPNLLPEFSKLELELNSAANDQEIITPDKIEKLQIYPDNLMQKQESDILNDPDKLQLDPNGPIGSQDTVIITALEKLDTDIESVTHLQGTNLNEEPDKLKLISNSPVKDQEPVTSSDFDKLELDTKSSKQVQNSNIFSEPAKLELVAPSHDQVQETILPQSTQESKLVPSSSAQKQDSVKLLNNNSLELIKNNNSVKGGTK